MNKPGLPLILVEWLDANTDNEPVTQESVIDVHKPYVIHTLGWLLYEDSDGITLVNEFYLDSFRGRTFIPRGMVKSVTNYSLTRKRQPRTKAASTPSSQEHTGQ